MFSREFLLTTQDASVPPYGQQSSSPSSEQHPSDDGLSTEFPKLFSDLCLEGNEESSLTHVKTVKTVLPDEEKTLTHENDEQSDEESMSEVTVSGEECLSAESVPYEDITLPKSVPNDEITGEDSAMPDKEIMVENELTEENFLKYFLLPLQNLIKLGMKINKELLERSKTKPLWTCPGEVCLKSCSLRVT